MIYKFKTVDISFRDDMHNGLESVEVNKKYLEMYPELNNLLLVLKKFIYQCNVFGPYSGGLSSYGLFLMILGYLQNEGGNKPISHHESRPTQNYFSETNTQNIPQNREKYVLNLRVA
jgi:DNA polymerase sigma